MPVSIYWIGYWTMADGGRVIGLPYKYIFLTRPEKIQWIMVIWSPQSGMVMHTFTSLVGHNNTFRGQTFQTVIVDLLHSRWQEEERGDITYEDYYSKRVQLQHLYEKKMQDAALEKL